jgi:hypothetical protein
MTADHYTVLNVQSFKHAINIGRLAAKKGLLHFSSVRKQITVAS